MVPDYRRTTLAPRHRRVVRALAEALFSHESGAPATRFDDLVVEVDRVISAPSKTLRFGLVRMLDAIWLLPPFLVGRFRVFDELSLADRVRMLEAMERSRFAVATLVFVAWKTVLTMLFFEQPEELAATGYPGPARARWQRALPLADGSRAEADRPRSTHSARPAPASVPPPGLPFAAPERTSR